MPPHQKKRDDSLQKRISEHYLTSEQVQELLGCSYETIWRMRKDGRIDPRDVVKLGQRLYIKRPAIVRLMKQLLPLPGRD